LTIPPTRAGIPDVVRLVSEGLANNDIATQLFISNARRAIPPHPRLYETRPYLTGATRSRGGPPRLKARDNG